MLATIACPCCGRPVPAADDAPASFPFCSARCRTVDLGRWLDGSHVIAGEPLVPPSSDRDSDLA